MAMFLTGEELNNKIYDIIHDAQDYLLIVSPFIKLDEYFKKLFLKHKNNYKVRIDLVFGKNENNAGRSLNAEDLSFFTQFPNVTVFYLPNLHAKYYGNESSGVITSINLYDYSFRNNIEFGVYTESSLFDKFTTTVDKQAWEYCIQLTKTSNVIFARRPLVESKFFKTSYMGSQTLFDATTLLLAGKKYEVHKLSEFEDEIDYVEANQSERPTRESFEQEIKAKQMSSPNDQLQQQGYCIRTGVSITYNPQRPMCYEAFQSWSKFKNMDYEERYCHKTGKKSNGKTSMRNPIMH